MGVVETNAGSLDTWPKLLEHNGRVFGAGLTAMRYKHHGIWDSYSWADYLERVRHLACGLLSLGFAPGDRLLIVGGNTPEWYFAQLAAQCNRGISVGLYSDLSAAEIEQVARECEVRFALVEDQEQVDKVLAIQDRLPGLKTVIYWRYRGLSAGEDNRLIGLREVLERGRRYEQDCPHDFLRNVAATRAEDICSVVYTSGATGSPKGAMHSYRSLMAGAVFLDQVAGLKRTDRLVSYLPPAWIAEQWLPFGCHLLRGCTVVFPESLETHEADIREVGPTVVNYVSSLWESLARQARARMAGATPVKRAVSTYLLSAGLTKARIEEEGARSSAALRFLDLIGEGLVFRRVRHSLGLGRTRVCFTHGCVLPPETVRFLRAVRVPLQGVYGSAEAGAIGVRDFRSRAPGASFSMRADIEVKLTAEGELLVRHPGAFLGYFNYPQATAAVCADAWVATGDCCQVRGGDLLFMGRLDDLLVLPEGGLLSLREVENRLKCSPFIREAWVPPHYQDGHLSAVIIIDRMTVGRWADRNKVTFTTFADLSQKPEVYQLIRREIELVNRSLPVEQRIGRFVNFHKEFDPDEGELTRNRKLRRALLTSRYSGLVQALVDGSPSVEIEAEIAYRDGRTSRLRTVVGVGTVAVSDDVLSREGGEL